MASTPTMLWVAQHFSPSQLILPRTLTGMIEGWPGAAVAGVAAGLGVAMPLGAIGALLLREGLVNGFAVAAAGAAGVAAVDTAYCAVATTTGSLFAGMIAGHRGVFLLASGALIVLVGLRQLVVSMNQRTPETPAIATGTAWGAFARFVGLTAINPMTLIYFIALSGAVTAPAGSWVVPAVFVAAVGVASLSWQLVLAGSGSLLRRAVNPGVARIVGVAAAGLVVALGAVVVVSGLTAVAP